MSLFGKILKKLGIDRSETVEPVPQPLPTPRSVPSRRRPDGDPRCRCCCAIGKARGREPAKTQLEGVYR